MKNLRKLLVVLTRERSRSRFRLVFAFLSSVAFLLPGAPRVLAQTAEQLLEEAFFLESTTLNPQGAIEKYRAVLATPKLGPSTAARAHLRLGICYHLLGRSQKAREQFETVAADFPTETAAVKLARRMLVQPVGENPARFLPPDALFYAEFVDPGKHVHSIMELLKDTPYQNLVDVYTSYLAQRATGETIEPDKNTEVAPLLGPPSPRAVRSVSAFLNEGFLRELGNIQGAALCYPSPEAGTDEFIFVLFPGKSHIVRGSVQFFLAERNARMVASVGEYPIFKVPTRDDESLYIAFSDAVVLVSNVQKNVQESIQRSLGESLSLAENEDYQETLSARSGSLIFSYINIQSLLGLLERQTAEAERPIFRMTRTLLGLDHLGALSVTLSHSVANDALDLSLRLSWGSGSAAAWKIFRTPRVDPDLLEAIPADSLGFLALSLNRGPERWDTLYELLRRLSSQIPQPGQNETLRQLQSLNATFTGPDMQAFLGALRQVVIGIAPTRTRSFWPSSFLVLKMSDPRSGPRRFEDAVSGLAYSLLNNRASREFRTETVKLGGSERSVRVLEPLPQVTIQSLAVGDRLVVAASREVLEKVIQSRDGDAETLRSVSQGAAKVLFLRPAAISRRTGTLSRPEIQKVLLDEVHSALLHSREERGRLLVTLTVPEFQSTTKSILKRLATR